jgi:rhomboid protease GluP
MYEPPPGCATVLQTRQRDQCRDSRLVLEAVGIPVQTVRWDGCWLLIVEQDDLTVAAAELEAYRRENHDRAAAPPDSVPVYGGAAVGIVLYAVAIVVVALLAAQSAYGFDWMAAGRMQAGKVVEGEWWRVTTALTLHVDSQHLLSNLAMGGLFCYFAGRVLGGGVGWLVIVSAGSLGNWINAMVQPPEHTSIGASTAVFAALGVIVAHAFRHRDSSVKRPLKRWSPLIGGVLLLAFTGLGGERTDVVAHVTGFLAGLLVGWIGCRMPHDWMADRRIQGWSGAAAVAAVAVAWFAALVASG